MKQHPLSSAFPAMAAEQFEAYRDGITPMTFEILRAMIGSDWFMSLNKGQRALYAVDWFDHLAVGSNQHHQRVKQTSRRLSAMECEALIGRASHA